MKPAKEITVGWTRNLSGLGNRQRPLAGPLAAVNDAAAEVVEADRSGSICKLAQAEDALDVAVRALVTFHRGPA